MIIFMCGVGTLNASLNIGNNMDIEFILQSYLTNAEIARSKGDCMSAIRFYMKYLKYKKNNAKVWNNLGVCLYKEGFYEKALESFKRAYFYKKKSLYLYNQALCFIILGKEDKACEIFKTLKIYDKPFLEKYPYFEKYCKDLKKDFKEKKNE